jgi:hypothetical protein
MIDFDSIIILNKQLWIDHSDDIFLQNHLLNFLNKTVILMHDSNIILNTKSKITKIKHH